MGEVTLLKPMGATMPFPPNHHESDKQRERATTRYMKLRDKDPLNIDLIKLCGVSKETFYRRLKAQKTAPARDTAPDIE
jgi:hypothetical protein